MDERDTLSRDERERERGDTPYTTTRVVATVRD
jgi:hypothetical protein